MISIKKSYIITFILIMVLLMSTFILTGFRTNQQGNTSQNNKYFKSIEIEEGDSLWSIASEYVSEEYNGIEEYIKELKSMNGLKGDTIHAGGNLIVAYYSDEIK